MSGGAKSSASAPAPAPVYRPVNAPEIPTTGYGGMGYYNVPSPFVQGSKPAWMQGYFDMPSWGMDAVTGQPLTQEQLQVQQPPPPAPAPVQAPQQQQQQAPVDMDRMYDLFARQHAWEQSRGDMMQQDGIGAASVQSMFYPASSPMAQYERRQIMNRLSAGGATPQVSRLQLMLQSLGR